MDVEALILPAYIDTCQDNDMSVTTACCPALTDGELDVDRAETMATMFKALGDPVRLRLVAKIASSPGGEACVCDILDVGVSQPTVSHHLKRLREAGLVTSRKQGTWVHYAVAPGALRALAAFLADPA